MACAAELGDALDDDPLRAGAGDVRAHLVEAIGDVDDLGLARGILDHGRALGQRSRHDRRMRAADRDLGKDDLAALEPVRRGRHDIAAVDLDVGPELGERHDQEIDRPRADGAAARHRHPRPAHARNERRDHPEAGAHLGNELVGRGGIDDIGRGDVQGLAVIGSLAGPLAADHDVDAVIAEDALQEHDVGEPRHIVENERLLGEEARDHQRERGVLGSRDRYRAGETPPTDDANTVHCHPSGPIPGRGC